MYSRSVQGSSCPREIQPDRAVATQLRAEVKKFRGIYFENCC